MQQSDSCYILIYFQPGVLCTVFGEKDATRVGVPINKQNKIRIELLPFYLILLGPALNTGMQFVPCSC